MLSNSCWRRKKIERKNIIIAAPILIPNDIVNSYYAPINSFFSNPINSIHYQRHQLAVFTSFLTFVHAHMLSTLAKAITMYLCSSKIKTRTSNNLLAADNFISGTTISVCNWLTDWLIAADISSIRYELINEYYDIVIWSFLKSTFWLNEI